MRLIDTHCHLYAEEFGSDIDLVIQRGLEKGVERFYLPAIDSSTEAAMLALETKYPHLCFAMAGLHPCSVKANYREELNRVESLLKKRPFVAVGEIGLDYYWDRTFEREQLEAFHTQIEWALFYNIPIVIHSRESMEACIKLVKEHQIGSLKGIFHCFSGTYEQALQVIELGFYLGIGGVLTYKKSGLAEWINQIGLEHLVLETDAPYLTPVPFRGKRNESAYLTYIVEKLAQLKKISPEEAALTTTLNAEKIFGI